MSENDQFTVVSEVYRNERRSKVLTRLPTNFYVMSEEYLARQREEYNQAVLIPSNPKTMMLQDQVKKVEKRLKHIYEIRERKIALVALDSMGGSKAPENMTKKDKELYEMLVATLRSFREGVEPPEIPERPKKVQRVETKQKLDVEKSPHITAIASTEAEKSSTVSQPTEKDTTAPPETAVLSKDEESPDIYDAMIVHVLEDIPAFVGAEHTYNLRKDDMVTLPSQFANLLSSKGKVKIVEG